MKLHKITTKASVVFTEAEARTLLQVLTRVGGAPATTGRGVTDELMKALIKAFPNIRLGEEKIAGIITFGIQDEY